MPTTKTKKGPNPAAVAAGVVAATAAAGAAYYFYGAKHAKQHRGQAVRWAKELKRDVIREAKKLEKVDEVVMQQVIDRAARTYRGLQSVDPVAVRAAANELKKNWRAVAKELAPKKKAVKKRTAKKRA